MLLFRRAAAEDLDAASAVLDEARAFIARAGIDQWQDGRPGREEIAEDIRAGCGYVAWDGGVAAYAALILTGEPGYAALRGEWSTAEGEYATIHRVAVCDRLRRTGVASALFGELERVSLLAGMRSVRVDTHRGNAAMNAFLQKRGYRLAGEVDYGDQIPPPLDPIRLGYEKLL